MLGLCGASDLFSQQKLVVKVANRRIFRLTTKLGKAHPRKLGTIRQTPESSLDERAADTYRIQSFSAARG